MVTMKIVNTQGTDDRQALPGSARKTATLPSAEQSRRQTFPTEARAAQEHGDDRCMGGTGSRQSGATSGGQPTPAARRFRPQREATEATGRPATKYCGTHRRRLAATTSSKKVPIPVRESRSGPGESGSGGEHANSPRRQRGRPGEPRGPRANSVGEDAWGRGEQRRARGRPASAPPPPPRPAGPAAAADGLGLQELGAAHSSPPNRPEESDAGIGVGGIGSAISAVEIHHCAQRFWYSLQLQTIEI
jgi:hypothetical protein